MSADRTRALLEASGYEVRFRIHEWVECLIAGDGESWLGRGFDRESALAAALREACPTTLSARLLIGAVAASGSDRLEGLAPARWPPWDGEGSGVAPVRTPAAPAIRLAPGSGDGELGPSASNGNGKPAGGDDEGFEAAASVASASQLASQPLRAASLSSPVNSDGGPGGPPRVVPPNLVRAARDPSPAAGPSRLTQRPLGGAPLPSVMVRGPVTTTTGAALGVAHAEDEAAENLSQVAPPPPPPPPPIEERTPGQIAVIISRPTVPRPPSGSFALPLPEPRPVYEPPSVATPDEALEELDILVERINDSREELGLCAPDRQRLAMLAWICLARSHTDGFPDDVRIRDRVSAISRLLTEIGKTFWPGSVTALQLHMQPRDLPRHLLGGVATTWRRAAELAEQALRNKEHEDERRSYDVHGWADRKLTFPRPAQPDRLLEALYAEVVEASGPLDLQAAPSDASLRPDGPTFLRWVRTLRWLRGADIDPDIWARLCGRFRWWAFRRDQPLALAAKELEPSYAPPSPWAQVLGQDPEKRRHAQRLRDVLGRPPDPNGDPRTEVLEWLARALPFGDTHHGNIVQMMQPHAELVLAIKAEDLPGADRRVRRRLARLQEDLAAKKNDLKIAPLPELSDDGEEIEAPPIVADEDGGARLPSELVDRVRQYTKGKRSVFVGHRRDPQLQASLREAFEFEVLDCRIAEPRRVEQLGEAIGDGRYDIVLGATGFQSHSLDKSLARACRLAGIHYVRVNQGEAVTCLRAVARDFAR